VAVGDMDFPPRGVFHPHKTATPARQYRPARPRAIRRIHGAN